MKTKTISYKYDKSYILDNVTLNMEEQVVNILIGYNGAGKTTLLDILSGSISLPSFLPPYPLKDTAYQPQVVKYSTTILVKDLIKCIANKNTLYNDSESIYISKLKNKKLGTLSSGELRWLTVMLIAKLEKKFFIFDEPTSGIDSKNKLYILSKIKEIANKQNKIVIVTTHDISEYSEIPCKIHFLNNGRIEFEGNYLEFEEYSENNKLHFYH